VNDFPVEENKELESWCTVVESKNREQCKGAPVIPSPSSKFRMTRQRQFILEELQGTKSHPTAEEICQLVRQRLPRISLGTVYRNLEILASCNLIQKLEFAGCQRRFDGTVENHYHVRCSECGRVEDLPLAQVPFDEAVLREATAYTIYSHRIEFFGVCPRCRQDARTGHALAI
jgi:Fur family ferric uptake transcriptional regulator